MFLRATLSVVAYANLHCVRNAHPAFVLGVKNAALEKLPLSEVMPLPAHVQARVQANIEQHTACRRAVTAQQRKDLCWWEP
jgi:hypothetical protein